jgi:hypothetical protein
LLFPPTGIKDGGLYIHRDILYDFGRKPLEFVSCPRHFVIKRFIAGLKWPQTATLYMIFVKRYFFLFLFNILMSAMLCYNQFCNKNEFCNNFIAKAKQMNG